MIISWFTQPKSGFSSYYQYDTVTQQFSRVRLELGRNSTSGRTNDTFASYNSKRAVGFSKDRLPFDSNDPGQKWSLNKAGELCYEGQPLPGGRPSAGNRVYDATDPSSFVHSGNPVTEKPSLPPDIKPEHLALLANDAMVTKSRINLTGGGVSETQLSEAIKGHVVRITGAKDFASVNDDMILAKLTSQAESIRGTAVGESVSGLEKALTSAQDSTALVGEQITEGMLTPTQEFEEAFGSLEKAVSSARTASSDVDVRQAVAEVEKAQQSVKTAIEDIDVARNESVARQLDSARESLSEAEQHVTVWESVETEYKPLEEASSVEDYVDTMSGTEDL